MRLGLIARACNTGLGNQTWAFAQHLHPHKVLVVDVCDLSPKNLTLRLDRFPGARVTQGLPSQEDCEWLLTDVDVVYSAETFYARGFVQMALDRGVATVLHVNPEFCDWLSEPGLPKPTLFACPSTWLYDQIPEPKMLLPMPVDTNHYPPRTCPETAHSFRHVIGHPAIHDRAGTSDLLMALRKVTADVDVTITCQSEDYARQHLYKPLQLPPNVTLTVDTTETENYWDIIGDADVLLAPRRFGGLYLTVNEGLGSGIPVIMTDISPNKDWLPPEWLVAADHMFDFMTRIRIGVYQAWPNSLARLIDRFATDADFYAQACEQARHLGHTISWKRLLPEYQSMLQKAVEAVKSPIS